MMEGREGEEVENRSARLFDPLSSTRPRVTPGLLLLLLSIDGPRKRRRRIIFGKRKERKKERKTADERGPRLLCVCVCVSDQLFSID